MKSILDKIFRKSDNVADIYKIRISNIEITEGYLEQDKDAKIEEYWIESIAVSEDAYWCVVGRRHGLFSLYKYNGQLVRLPARPPSQAVVDVVFKDKYLAISSPPYVSVYNMIDFYNPKTWQNIKLSQEGLRPTGGLDLSESLLVYGAISDQVVIIDLDFTKGLIEPKNIFRLQDFGGIKLIKVLQNKSILFCGPTKSVITDMNGNTLHEINIPSQAFCVKKDTLYIANEKELIVYDVLKRQKISNYNISYNVNSLDVYENIVFLADKDENKLILFDLNTSNELGILESGGYSVVKIASDGSIYTSFYDRQNKLYYLKKFETNLLDIYYPKDRQEAIIKNAKHIYKDFKKKLQLKDTESALLELKELETLISYPFKDTRDLIEKAKLELDQKRIELKFEYFKDKIANNNIDAKVFEELLEFGRLLDKSYQEEFEALKSMAMESLKSIVDKHLSIIETTLSKANITNQIQAESIEEIKKAREVFFTLPQEIQHEAFERLNKLIQRFIVNARLEKYKIIAESNYLKIGETNVAISDTKPKKLRWQLKIEDKVIIGQDVYSKISFEREDGILREPKRYNNYLSMEQTKHKPRWIGRYLSKLNGLFGHQSYGLDFTISFEDTPWFVENLELLSKILNEQSKYKEGIVIIEGDAGVGKNFLVEVYAALTKRPLFVIPCHSKMEKEDITFVYEYDPKVGTKRTKSNLIKALETPNAIIYFDEINTLPASLVKIFNQLFDYRRYMYLSYDSVVKAQEGVLLVGGMNPQNYLGVSELPQDIKSRAEVIYIDYPPFEDEKGFYYPDEALILKDYMVGLDAFMKEDFVYLWYEKINGIRLDKTINATETDIKNMFKIFDLLKIASRIRKAYRDYQSGQSDEAVDFVFSMRDTIRCARKLNDQDDVKKVVKSTVLPKISNLFERKTVESLIEEVG